MLPRQINASPVRLATSQTNLRPVFAMLKKILSTLIAIQHLIATVPSTATIAPIATATGHANGANALRAIPILLILAIILPAIPRPRNPLKKSSNPPGPAPGRRPASGAGRIGTVSSWSFTSDQSISGFIIITTSVLRCGIELLVTQRRAFTFATRHSAIYSTNENLPDLYIVYQL